MGTSSAMSLEDSVEATLNNLREVAPQWRAQPYTIFRVPSYVRESDRTAYEPRMVSIGPYYHGNEALRAMEEHKLRYFHGFMSRNTELQARTVVEEIRSLEARARACYSERPTKLNTDDFVQMLILDGCFIIEFFFKWHTKEPDALCDVGWGSSLITTDLLLLENQIPFFVVERLFGFVHNGPQDSRKNLLTLLLCYIGNDDEEHMTIPSGTCDIHHLLHLYHESFVPKLSPRATTCWEKMTTCWNTKRKMRSTRVIPGAAELSAAGVSFQKVQEQKIYKQGCLLSAAGMSNKRVQKQNIYHVVFHRHRGVMKIPSMVIDGMKRPLLTNLMALEQTQGVLEPGVVSSYVWLMGMLVRSPEDVQLLRERDILDNLLANDEEAARFFSHLGDGGAMNYDRMVFTDLHDDLLRYYDSCWHKNMAKLRRDYFSNPWSAIALIFASLAFALTAIQTYFTVFPKK